MNVWTTITEDLLHPIPSVWNAWSNGHLVAPRSTSRTRKKGACRCLGIGRTRFGSSGRCMLVTVPSAVGRAVMNVKETVASSVGWRRTPPLAWLQTSCSEPQPNQFFYAPPHRTALYLCGLQETVTAANLCTSFTKTLETSTLATIEGFWGFFLVWSQCCQSHWKHGGC